MKQIFLIFILLATLQGQTVLNETFSNFFPDSIPAYAFWPMDNTTYPPNSINDRSGNSKTLTVGAATAGQTQASILVSGGYSEDFNASGSFFRHDDAYWNVLSTSGFSFFCALRMASITGSQFIYTRDSGSGSTRQLGFLFSGGNARFQGFQGGANTFYRPKNGLSINTWYLFTGVFDTTSTGSINLYVNGVASTDAVVGTINDTLNTPTGVAFNVSGIGNGTLDFDGDLSILAIYRGVLTAKQAKEMGFLAANWHSKNGGVTRDAWAFSQGIVADTVYHSIATPGPAIGRVDAWAASGTPTLYVFNKAGDSQSFVLDTDSTRYTINQITFAASDSVYFRTTGTVYIDNVYLETAPPPAAASPEEISALSRVKKLTSLNAIDD